MNQDSVIRVFNDSIKVLTSQPKTFWEHLSLWDTNLLIFLGALLSIIATIVIQLYLHVKSYKNEYYKKLINKRLSAYEEVEKFLLNFRTYLTDGSNSYFAMFSSASKLNTFIIQVNELSAQTIWLSSPFANKFFSFNTYINSLNLSFDDSSVKRIGIEQFSYLSKFDNEIRQLLYNDILELHNIKSFIKQKKIYLNLIKEGTE